MPADNFDDLVFDFEDNPETDERDELVERMRRAARKHVDRERYARVWKEWQHPRGQPGNAGQFVERRLQVPPAKKTASLPMLKQMASVEYLEANLPAAPAEAHMEITESDKAAIKRVASGKLRKKLEQGIEDYRYGPEVYAQLSHGEALELTEFVADHSVLPVTDNDREEIANSFKVGFRMGQEINVASHMAAVGRLGVAEQDELAEMVNKISAAVAQRKKAAEKARKQRTPMPEDEVPEVKLYRKYLDSAMENMNAKCLARAAQSVDDIRLYQSISTLTSSEGYGNDRQIAGLYNFRDHLLKLDGAPFWTSAEQVYAHELTHCVDWQGRLGEGGGFAYSTSKDWINAWFDEIIPDEAMPNGNGGFAPLMECPLSEYACSMPSEGFAEFGRLVFLEPDKAKQFKKCYKFWQDKGLVDPEPAKKKAKPKSMKKKMLEEA